MELADLWRSHHGARFRLYKVRSDKGVVREKRTGTDAHIRRQQMKGLDFLVSNARQRNGRCRTILGCRRQHLPKHSELHENPCFNEGLEGIYDTATKRMEEKRKSTSMRELRPQQHPYKPTALKVATLVSRSEEADPEASLYTRKPMPKVIDLATGASAPLPPGSFRSTRVGPETVWRSLLEAVRACDILVISTFDHLLSNTCKLQLVC